MRYLVLIVSLCVVSCTNDGQKVREEAAQYADSVGVVSLYPKEIVGKWESVSLQVAVNADSAYNFTVGSGKWESTLGRKPFKTHFKANNTYQIDYPDLNDSITETRRGIWNLFGDTLLLIENVSTYDYLITIKKDHIQYRSKVDWDNDGAIDDIEDKINFIM